MRQHHRITHPGTGQQAGFDLTQFDAIATYLHLLVVAPQVFQRAVRRPARHIARAVETRQLRHLRVGMRIGDEALGGECGAPQITTRQACSGDMDLARHAAGHRLQAMIEQQHAQVGDGHADGAGLAALDVGARDGAVADMHRGLGDAIHVDETGGVDGVVPEPGPEAGKLQRLATEDHQTQAVGELLAVTRSGRTAAASQPCRLQQAILGQAQGAEGAGGLIEHRHPLDAQQAVELLGGACQRLRHHDQAAAMTERPPDLPHRKIEGIGMEQGPHIVRRETEPGLTGAQQTCDLAVFYHHPLGRPGGARGVDDIGQMLAVQALDLGITCAPGGRLGRTQWRQFIEQQACAGRRLQVITQRGLRQHELRTGIIEDVFEALGGGMRIERQIGSARLEYGQQRHQHVQATLDTHRHPAVGLRPGRDQALGQTIGAPIEFAITELFTRKAHGAGLRLTPRLRFHRLMQQGSAAVVLHGGVKGAQQLCALGRRQDVERLRQHLAPLQASLQGRGQRLQRRHEIDIDAWRRNRCRTLRHQGKTFTQIIDVEGQRIIGALATGQQLDPRRPIEPLPLMPQRRAVAIVEHGGE